MLTVKNAGKRLAADSFILSECYIGTVLPVKTGHAPTARAVGKVSFFALVCILSYTLTSPTCPLSITDCDRHHLDLQPISQNHEKR